jgi:hypothetical protein
VAILKVKTHKYFIALLFLTLAVANNCLATAPSTPSPYAKDNNTTINDSEYDKSKNKYFTNPFINYGTITDS